MRLRFLGLMGAIAVLGAAVLWGCAARGDAPPARLRVAAAASLRPALTDLARSYKASGGPQLSISYAGSSLLARQLVEGAPFDVLITADHASMEIAAAGGAVGAARALLSNEAVVVVSHRARHPVARVADLTQPGLVVVVCAPQAACGAVADRVLAQAGVRLENPAREPDVNAVMTKVRLGEADAGIVYRTDAIVDRVDHPVRILKITPPVTTTYFAAPVAGRGASVIVQADRFLDFLESTDAWVVFHRHGFGRP